MFVNGKIRLNPVMTNVDHDEFVPGLSKITSKVHEAGGKMVVQIVHVGAKAAHFEVEAQSLSPSGFELVPGKPAKEITRAEIAEVASHFAKAAARCKAGGADGVQILAGHGYLLSQFLSPHFNKRTDEYGGEIANRGRIVIEVYEAMRKEVGPDYPIWIKINSNDLVEKSINMEEFLWLCQELDKKGIDAIEVSAGIGVDRDSSPAKPIKEEADEASYAKATLALAACVKATVIGVGGFRTPSVIDEFLNKGNITAVGLSRPLVREPGLVNRWKGTNKDKATCISCNKCFRPKAGYGCQQDLPKA